MLNEPNIESTVDGLDEFLKDLYKSECKKTAHYMILSYVLMSLLAIVTIFCGLLLLERTQYDKVVVTTTTDSSTSYDYDVSGGSANIVNGDQYNDSKDNNSGGD